MRYSVFAAILIALAVVGCYELEEEYVVNPDLSGKVDFKMTMPMSNPMMPQPNADPKELAKKAVKKMLDESKGVETWKDVEYKIDKDGNAVIKGTAYFKEIEKLKFQYGDLSSESSVSVKKQEDGSIVIEFKPEDDKSGAEGEAPKMTDEEVKAAMQDQKMQYQQSKPMIASMMEGLKNTFTFHVPGELGECSNFKKLEDGRVSLTLEGKKLMASMDKVMSDDKLLEEMVRAGKNPQTAGMNDKMAEMMFGEAAPVKAIFKGEMKALFDFEKEVAEAKEAYGEMMKKLGLAEDK